MFSLEHFLSVPFAVSHTAPGSGVSSRAVWGRPGTAMQSQQAGLAAGAAQDSAICFAGTSTL